MFRLAPPIFGTQQDQLARCEEMLDEYINRSKSKKKKKWLTLLKPAILQRWKAYFDASGDPEQYGASVFARSSDGEGAKTDGDLLFGCYSSGSGADGGIIATISGARVSKCPYCGLRFRRKPHQRAYDRDHVIPRSSFPEFSILAMNLVSACDDCNDAKQDKVVDAHGKWLFIHPYFDEFLSTTVIAAEVKVESSHSRPTISFSTSFGNLRTPDAQRLHRHVQHLDILARMEDEAVYQLQLLLDLQRLHEAEPNEIRRVFDTLAKERLAVHPNDPVGIVLEAVAASEHLCAFLS